MKRSTGITLLIIAAVVGLFFYMTTASATRTCRVCVGYGGNQNCATAKAATVAAARQGAQATACGTLAHGMNETIACGNAQPRVVECGKS